MIESTSRFYVGTRSGKGAGVFLQPRYTKLQRVEVEVYL